MAGTGQAPRAFRWAVHMFRHARDRWPDVRFHLWGVTNRQFLDNLPAYSADSSGILGAAYRYASLRLFDPATGRHHTVILNKTSRGVYKLAPVLRRVYGVTPAEIETSHPGNRVTLIQLAAASTQQYAAWLQRRHQVSPPARTVNSSAPPVVGGTRTHAAFATSGRSQADEVAVVNGAPAGTRVAGAHQPPDLLPVVDGTLLHVADTYPRHLSGLTTDRTVT